MSRSRVVEAELRRRRRTPADSPSAAAFFDSVVLPGLNEELSGAGLPRLASLRLLESELSAPDLTPTGAPDGALRQRLAATAVSADRDPA